MRLAEEELTSEMSSALLRRAGALENAETEVVPEDSTRSGPPQEVIDDSVRLYLGDIGGVKLLTAQQEVSLARDIEASGYVVELETKLEAAPSQADAARHTEGPEQTHVCRADGFHTIQQV